MIDFDRDRGRRGTGRTYEGIKYVVGVAREGGACLYLSHTRMMVDHCEKLMSDIISQDRQDWKVDTKKRTWHHRGGGSVTFSSTPARDSRWHGHYFDAVKIDHAYWENEAVRSLESYVAEQQAVLRMERG